MNDEFYIGWEDQAAPGIRKAVHRAVAGLFAAALVICLFLAMAQKLIGTAVFEWGNVKKFSGILQAAPYPCLLVPRPGKAGDQPRFSTYTLVAPFKYGLQPEAIAAFDGKPVALSGTLIYRGNQTMIEVADGSMHLDDKAPAQPPLPAAIPLGKQTLTGEIVDSKCFLGVMNPGQLAPHRGCAIRCISGGIPPVLLVRQPNQAAIYFMLVSPDGKPINQQVLDFIAEPVQITGEVERQGDMLILRADPATFRRVGA